ncbi:DUF349 domain-containing protein [Canibacter zhoujuaniae]|uniref:DUF349 domain-containing protein n=1 Tax=Canibacter zhoujuaniae TaxID=2708343 RepID=UPI001FBB9C88|nr:DUF349 domain-containing protein [Canibacter zhoujuaniae]
MTAENTWGRVDETGNVFVKDSDSERLVGQFQDGTSEEALAYFTRKYDDLAYQVTLLEARIARGTANANVTQSVEKLEQQVAEPHAVGDLQALRDRVATLKQKANDFAAAEKARKEAARKATLAERDAIATEAERLAAQPAGNTNWKKTAAQFEELFAKWQHSQRNSAPISKSQSDAQWRRFRAARSTFETTRRQYFLKIDAENKEVRQIKEKLITKAEALAPKGAEGVDEYRLLLDEWKTVKRASRKLEDSLWARFKAAGDTLFAARAEELAAVDEEYKANQEKKEALLADLGSQIKSEPNYQEARKLLANLQEQWAEIGRVPRDQKRKIEDQLRQLQDHVADLEAKHWEETDPEPEARASGLREQLEQSIAQLEAELTTANPSQKVAIEEKLATQKAWLTALG